MNIIYGVLPYQYLKSLSGIKGLVGLSIGTNAVLQVKFIEELNDGILFSALITDNNSLNYSKFCGEIQHLIISPRKTRTLRTLTNKQLSNLSENAIKKRRRREKNLTLTEKNWKQFIGKKHSIISFYQSLY